MLFIGFFSSVTSYGFQDPQKENNKTDSLSYGSLSEMGIDSIALYEGIEHIILEAMDSGAFPGCSILLVKDGKIFYENTFGYHTYERKIVVKKTDLYDLASLTKVTAATLALMRMYDDGKLDLDKTLGDYFPNLIKSNKAHLSIRKVLAHQSALKSWIPYYKVSQKKNGKFKRKTVATDSSAKYPYSLTDKLFLHKNFKENKIYNAIKKSPLYEEEKYVYSGLSFYLWPDLIESTYSLPFNDFLKQEFYEPIRAKSLGFLPTNSYSLNQIVPTEVDTYFRQQLLHGIVHDEGAAMMLGISGNAGLFSNAKDLAKVFQMLLNGGTYKGKEYLTEKTISEFTKCQYPEQNNRRGLGFDKPLLAYDSIKSSVSRYASPDSFGHSGYTGTFVWADPKYDFIYIFLSNRVHPTRDNRLIYELNIRPRIHELAYELLKESGSILTE